MNAVMSVLVLAGLLWVLSPHPRSYTVAADTYLGSQGIAEQPASGVDVAYRAADWRGDTH